MVGYNTDVTDMKRVYKDSLNVMAPCFSFKNNAMYDWSNVRKALSTSSTAPMYGLVGPGMKTLYGKASGSVSALRTEIEKHLGTTGIVQSNVIQGDKLAVSCSERAITIHTSELTSYRLFVHSLQGREIFKSDLFNGTADPLTIMIPDSYRGMAVVSLKNERGISVTQKVLIQ